MKAVLLRGYGGVEQLAYEDVPDPQLQTGQVLVRTAATSINPIDWKLRRGDMKERMPLDFPAILGRDVSGEIVALGPGVSNLQVGQRVFGLVNHSYAELVACNAVDLAALPDDFNGIDAAALPLVILTGTQLIEMGVKPIAGQTVLVTGSLGSVGRTAVHVARHHGAKVIACVRGSELSRARELGADEAIAVDDAGSVSSLPVLDAIADTVGHDVIGKLIHKLLEDGVLATVVGRPQAAEGRNIRVVGVWAKPDPARMLEVAWGVQRGRFAIPIGKRFKLSQIQEAQSTAEKGGIGKIVLTP